MRLRRGGIWSLVSVTPGCGRAMTLALLCEGVTRNAVRASHSPPEEGKRKRFDFSSSRQPF